MWNNPHLLVLDEPTNFLDRDSLGGLAVAIRDFKGGVILISHNEEFVGALCSEQWLVNDGRVAHRSTAAVHLDRFEDAGSAAAAASPTINGSAGSRPASAIPSTVNSTAASTVSSAVNSGAEDVGELKFKAKKKRKKTKKELKEQEVRRRLRHIEWLNSPKGTPHPPDTDEDE